MIYAVKLTRFRASILGIPKSGCRWPQFFDFFWMESILSCASAAPGRVRKM